MYFGSLAKASDPLPPKKEYSLLPLLNLTPYGGDCGGCRTYGDINYIDNSFNQGWQTIEEKVIDFYW